MSPLRVGVFLGGPVFAGSDAVRQLPELARQAETAGLDIVTIADHVVLGQDTSGYPYGPFPAPSTSPYPEPLTTLAAMAATTERIELAVVALIVPLRSAVLLAKTCATLDLLSGGRLILGSAAGWHDVEFEASAVPFARRGRRMDDALRACRVLWSDCPASFDSETVTFDEVHCEPRPSRRIPIWVGGNDVPRTIRRLLDYGDGWLPSPALDAKAIGAGVRLMRMALSGAAIPVAAFLPIVDGNLERSLATAPELVSAGVTVLQVPASPFVRSADQAPAFFARLAQACDTLR